MEEKIPSKDIGNLSNVNTLTTSMIPPATFSDFKQTSVIAFAVKRIAIPKSFYVPRESIWSLQ